MKLAVVTEYRKGRKCYFPEEAQGFIDFLSRKHDVYVIDPLRHERGRLKAAKVSTGKEVPLFAPTIDGVYFGLVGKDILRFKQSNCLNLELPQFFALFSDLAQLKSAYFVNHPDTIAYNMSKHYVLDLKKDLPFIDTEKVDSLDRLVELASGKEKMVAKPLISERAEGTVVLNGLSNRELRAYAKRWISEESSNGIYDSSGKLLTEHEDVIKRQGVIVQPYTTDFRQFGERKIAVVNGEVTLSRVNVDKDSEIVNVCDTAVMEKHKPTSEEVDLVKKAFHVFNQHYPVHYMRVDFTGEPGNLKISEIEAVNPHFAASDGGFSKKDLERHYKALMQSFQVSV